MYGKVEIKDENDLKNWLMDKPLTWTRQLTVRMALRVLPFVERIIRVSSVDDEEKEKFLLSMFRVNFISWAAAKYPAHDMRSFAVSASRAIDIARAAFCKNYGSGYSYPRDVISDNAANAASYAATAITTISPAARACAGDVARYANAAAMLNLDSRAARVAAANAFWKAISFEANWLTEFDGQHDNTDVFSNKRIIDQSLWIKKARDNSGFHKELRKSWRRLSKNEFAIIRGFLPWIAWYDFLLLGQIGDPIRGFFAEALSIRIATQSNEWWERGVAVVNADIARWLEESSTTIAPVADNGVRTVEVPPTTRLFVRLPDALARGFTPDALRAPTSELFQRVLALGPGAESSALLSSLDIGGTEASSGRMLTRDTLILENEEIAAFLKDKGAKLYRDVQFQILENSSVPQEPRCRYWEPSATTPNANGVDEGSLDDVLSHINVHEAWEISEGDGATIAVIDTGIHGDLPEIGHNRRHSLNPDTFHRDRHWVDREGHGSMCAVIAAGGGLGGRFKGVAPLASVLSCRTDFTAGDISDIYLNLIEARREGRISSPLVVNNSYGLYTCDSSGVMPDDHPYMDVIQMAIDEGIVVVFAAGNNHHDVKCKHPPGADGPNTIWGPNSHDRVLSVGTVNRNNSNQDGTTPHANSSRGPGEWAVKHVKPDCVAPTYGAVIWGNERRVMSWWGTSGAAPQVSGLAALIQAFAANTPGGTFRPDEINDIVRESCRRLSAPATCVGSGLIDCGAALKAAQRRR